jgi:hypothetical protein
MQRFVGSSMKKKKRWIPSYFHLMELNKDCRHRNRAAKANGLAKEKQKEAQHVL